MPRISQADKERVRDRLVETAADHFARDGFERANINRIALEAGFAKGTIYNYFASKEDLFAAVISEAGQRTVDRYSALEHEESTRAHLLALAQADISVLREEEAFMQVLVREAMSFRPETYPLILQSLAPVLQLLQDVLTRGSAGGEIRSDRPAPQLALMYLGTLSLLYVQHWGSGGGWPSLEEIPELAVSLFLDGVGTGNGGV